MILNIKRFSDVQKVLDKKIFETQHLSRAQVLPQAQLCIMIELMELCNETRCFNYWSKKVRGTDDDILEEFADVTCFTLSAIEQYHFDELELADNITAESKLQLTNRFLELTQLYAKLDDSQAETYKIFTIRLFELGLALGYNLDQIFESYMKKIEKNHKVQESFKN
ncbi:dUTP diphosphatase [Ureaplasma ceti]|uniref:dUTP diphosphatase n=1 Tax=Ureaplasma ceti TaxID=3119530 RepID=A0ABP9U641_9BACT